MGIASSHLNGLLMRLPGLGLEEVKHSWPAERFQLIQDHQSGSRLTSQTNEAPFPRFRFYFLRYLISFCLNLPMEHPMNNI